MRCIVSLVLALCSLQIAVSLRAQQPLLLVAVKGEQKLAIVNPETLEILDKVDETGFTGHEVAASPDGRYAIVPIYGNSGVGKPGTDGSKIVKIDLDTQKVVATLDFGRGVRPHCAVFDLKHRRFFVTTELDKTVTIVDPRTMKIVGSIPTGQEQSHMLAVSHDGKRGYTANVGPGTVSVLDMKTRKLIKVIPVSGNTQRIAITNDDKWVFTADQTKPQLAVIDTKALTIAQWIPLDGLGYGGVMTPDGRWFLITVPSKGEIEVIDLKTMQVARKIATQADPEEVIITPDDKIAWVSSPATGSVAEINLAKWEMVRKVETGPNSDGLAWAK